MRRLPLRWLGVAGAGLLVLVTAGMLFVALGAKGDASQARRNSARLYQAQLDVAEAQGALGGADLGDANRAALAANRTALRVGEVTSRIVDRLTSVRTTVDRITEVAERGSRNAVFARRQTTIAGDLLGSISGYQGEAVRLADITNRALERVLAALKRTNRNFPGGGS